MAALEAAATSPPDAFLADGGGAPGVAAAADAATLVLPPPAAPEGRDEIDELIEMLESAPPERAAAAAAAGRPAAAAGGDPALRRAQRRFLSDVRRLLTAEGGDSGCGDAGSGGGDPGGGDAGSGGGRRLRQAVAVVPIDGNEAPLGSLQNYAFAARLIFGNFLDFFSPGALRFLALQLGALNDILDDFNWRAPLLFPF